MLALLLGTPACSDDNAVTTSPGVDTEGTSTGTETLPSTVTLTTSVDATDTVPNTDTADTTAGTTDDPSTTAVDSTGSTGDTDGTTGEPVASGRTTNQLVTSGTRTSSRSYTVVYTLGQPSQLQSTHASTNYRVQGGLVGANGSPP